MDKFESMMLEAETVSALMIQMAGDDVGDTSFAVMSDLGENGTEHECDLSVHETALRASSVIDQLLTELEAKDKRIAELERANISQDDHINQQQDRIDSLEKTNAGLGRRLGDAEKRLATPVRFPKPCAFNLCDLVDRDAVIASLREQGFTVEGDE